MYALFTEVNADESHIEAARDFLPKVAVPMAREDGAKAGYWLAPQNGRGLSVVASTPKTKPVPWQPASRWASRRCLTRRPA
jgi:hypothetical protein